MRSDFPIAAALLLAVFPTFSGVAETVRPPVVHIEEQSERPTVAPTGSVVAVSSPGVDNAAGTPGGMAAARLAVRDRIFQWTPSPAPRATGGADLVGAAISPDESLLVLAERVGGAGALNSTRLVLVNLASGRIVNILELKERRIGEIAFPAGSSSLLAAQHAQPEFGHEAKLLLIDLRDGAVTAESAALPEPPRSFVSDGEGVWYTLATEKEHFFELPLSALAGAPKLLRTRAEFPRIIFGIDGRELVVYGRGQCEYYRIERGRATYDGAAALPEDFSPVWAAATSLPGGRSIVFGEADGPACLVGGGGALRIADKAGAQSCCTNLGKTLLVSVEARDALAPYALPSVTPGKEILPGRLKPANRNRLWRMLPRSGAEPSVVLIDIRGNVFLLTADERKPKKSPVLTVDRAGFR